jgi:hypothetical protein
MRETAGSPDMSVHMYQIAWYHIPKGGYFQNKKQHKREKRSHNGDYEHYRFLGGDIA